MAVVTVNGEYGSRARELGERVAQLLDANYVDRLILTEAAKRMGATVEALAEMEQRPVTFGERLSKTLQNMLERSAVSGLGGDFSPVIMHTILTHPYDEMSRRPVTSAQELDQRRFIEVITQVILDITREGSVVIVGRASNIVLKDAPGTFHVGVTTPYDERVSIIAEREGVEDRSTAEKMTQEGEKARLDFYHRAFQVAADDPSLYHLMINTGKLDFATASSIVTHAVRSLEDMEESGS